MASALVAGAVAPDLLYVGVLLTFAGYVLIWHALRLRRLQRERVAGL